MDLGEKIDPDAARMIKHRYVDNGISRGDWATASRLMEGETWIEGSNLGYWRVQNEGCGVGW